MLEKTVLQHDDPRTYRLNFTRMFKNVQVIQLLFEQPDHTRKEILLHFFGIGREQQFFFR